MTTDTAFDRIFNGSIKPIVDEARSRATGPVERFDTLRAKLAAKGIVVRDTPAA